MHKAIITVSLSEAQWNLYPKQSGNDSEYTFEINLPDGPWVQFTYDGLRHQDGSSTPLHFGADGFWHFGDRVCSDVTIEIVEAENAPPAP